MEYLSKTWGITINNDVVIDPSSSQLLFAVENAYGSHPITDTLQSQNMVSFFPGSRSLSINDKVENVQTTALVTTIDRSMG